MPESGRYEGIERRCFGEHPGTGKLRIQRKAGGGHN